MRTPPLFKSAASSPTLRVAPDIANTGRVANQTVKGGSMHYPLETLVPVFFSTMTKGEVDIQLVSLWWLIRRLTEVARGKVACTPSTPIIGGGGGGCVVVSRSGCGSQWSTTTCSGGDAYGRCNAAPHRMIGLAGYSHNSLDMSHRGEPHLSTKDNTMTMHTYEAASR
jgi:hypothetical protein